MNQINQTKEKLKTDLSILENHLESLKKDHKKRMKRLRQFNILINVLTVTGLVLWIAYILYAFVKLNTIK